MNNPLATLRRKAGLTMQQLADLAGTTAPQINKLEKGHRDLDKKWALRLAPHLKVSAEELLFPSQEKLSGSQDNADFKTVPVYGVISDQETSYPIDAAHIVTEKILHKAIMGNQGFYVTVVGTTMEPLFEAGQIVLVNPDAELVKGKPCLIETVHQETMIRKFISRTETILSTQQLNPFHVSDMEIRNILRVSYVVGQEF